MAKNFLRSSKKIIKITDGSARGCAEKFNSYYEELLNSTAVNYAAFHLREFDLTEHEHFELSRRFREVTTAFNLGFIVHRDPKLAEAVKADAVHLQFSTLQEVQFAKSLNLLVGVSCHSIEEVYLSEKAGADYVYLSPIFETLSKTSDLVPLGVEVLLEAKAGVEIPVIALGGISEENIEIVCPNLKDKLAGISI